MPNLYANFIGIDVSKNKLDVYDASRQKYFCFTNDKEGIKSLLKSFEPQPDLLVLIDLTGGYENLVVKSCFDSGFNVHRAQGRKIKNFLKGYGQRAKTDKIDAKMLTVYGAKMQETLRLYQPNDNILSELVSRREDLKDMLQKEKNRKDRFLNKAAKRSLSSSINFLEKQIQDIEDEIKRHLDNDKELKEKAKAIDSVKSVGDKTTMTLLAVMPELGKANRRQIAALAGLAPYANDSGSSSKKRRTSIGRPLAKKMLFMCAMVAINHNSYGLESFYQKLIHKGKLKMVAIVAVMRKLLIIINNRCKDFYAHNSFTNA